MLQDMDVTADVLMHRLSSSSGLIHLYFYLFSVKRQWIDQGSTCIQIHWHCVYESETVAMWCMRKNTWKSLHKCHLKHQKTLRWFLGDFMQWSRHLKQSQFACNGCCLWSRQVMQCIHCIRTFYPQTHFCLCVRENERDRARGKGDKI